MAPSGGLRPDPLNPPPSLRPCGFLRYRVAALADRVAESAGRMASRRDWVDLRLLASVAVGMVVAFVERDPPIRRSLERHWIPIH